MKLVLTNVRLSFPNLFKRATFDGKETKFEATFLIPKSDTETIGSIKADAKRALLDKFGSADKIPKGIMKGNKFCLRDGDDVDYDGYADHMSFKASNSTRPRTMDRQKNPIDENSGMLYAGCYVDAVVELWIQNNAYGSRINANVLAVRHRSHGDAFGAGGIPSDVESEFDDLEDEGYDGDDDDDDIVF